MSMPLLFDGIFAVILLVSIVLAAKKGAFKAISGIAGTLVGLVSAVLLKDAVSPWVESFLSPLVEKTVSGWDFSSLLTQDRTAPFFEKFSQLITDWQLSDNPDSLHTALVEAVSGSIVPKLAAIAAFLLIFFAAKLAVTLICRLLNDDIPIIRTMSKGLGALLGAVSGLLLILVLCWAVLRFAPDDGVSFPNQQSLRDSTIGGVVCQLFE